jgi:uncharacterized protein YecE (DUF72 family)
MRGDKAKSRAKPAPGRAYVGTSGYIYPKWRGPFYPKDLPARKWLTYAASMFNSIELNGTFYSLKSPAVFASWVSETPPTGFLFAIKGSRFITHNLKLARAEVALANFYASGVLALGQKTGPFLWQLPGTYKYSRARIEDFLALLPRSSADAEKLAQKHDARLKRGALLEAASPVSYRHAFEVRHPSYFDADFFDLLRSSGIAFVIADTAGKFPYAEEITADFSYVRLHGSEELYTSGYTDEELDAWAARIVKLLRQGLDVYTYFDNDAKAHAPGDARHLSEKISALMAAPRKR